MRTDDLITLLAAGAGPAPRALAARRLAPVFVAGGTASALGAIALIGRVPADLFTLPAWWWKFGYALAVGAAAAAVTARLGRPAARAGGPAAWLAAVLLVQVVAGVVELAPADPALRQAMWLGHSWSHCPFNVLALSLPALALALWALRGLAPTRPRAAGAAAGALAGGVGAAGYALSCTELSMAFVATWYTLGILACTLLGALLGPRLLRW